MKILEFTGPGFEDSELLYPYYRLQEEGHEVFLAGPEKKKYEGKNGVPVEADLSLSEINPDDFEALVIPGGHMPDKVRMDKDALKTVKHFMEKKKPIAVICHGGQVMISADVLKDIKMTSVENIKDDIENAGAQWMDEGVFSFENIVSAKTPKNLPEWMKRFTVLLSKNVKQK